MRSVPIHSSLTGIVERRCKGKQPEDYLFDELSEPTKGARRERSMPSVKRFSRYIRAHKETPVPLPSLRALLLTGSLATHALLREVATRLCTNPIVHFGASETGAIAEATLDQALEFEGATGFVLPGVEVEIVDEAGRTCPIGISGTVRVRSDAMASAFPANAASDHPSLREGWFYSGDYGRFEASGLLVLGGRVSQVISSGGNKLAPEIIEEVLLTHPYVSEVAAFGALGEEGIEVIHLAILATQHIPEFELRAWCAAHGLEIEKAHFVTALPKTPMGKLNREELKASLVFN